MRAKRLAFALIALHAPIYNGLHIQAVLTKISARKRTGKLQMSNSVFVEAEFFLLIVLSLVLPVSIYGYMMWKKAISRKTVLAFSIVLLTISGLNVLLLRILAVAAKNSLSLLDDQIFLSEMTVALYLLPAIFAGVGVNMLSHILISHLTEAEREFDQNKEK